MAPASPMLVALAAAARGRRGHEPWLFFPHDGHWRWWSFARAWTEIERLQAATPPDGIPARHAGAPPAEWSPGGFCRRFATAATAGGAPADDGLAGLLDELAGPPAPEREIAVVAPGCASSRIVWPWIDWCSVRLTALVLEPSPSALVGSILWCRPTLLLLDSTRERAVADAIAHRSGGSPRRAAALVDRLRLLLVERGPSPAPTDWQALGVDRRRIEPSR